MSVMKTHISWCDSTWNPTTGCTKVSAGCDHCYAEALTVRLWGGKFEDVKEHPKRLVAGKKFRPMKEPDGTLRPRLVFVNSMSDIFHEDISTAFRDQVFDVMEENWSTIFQCLTKRPHLLRSYVRGRFKGRSVPDNIWLGPSVEDNRVKGRLRIMRRLKEEVGDFTAFVSIEPIIGPTDQLDLSGMDWILTGGESGWHARLMDLVWLEDAHSAAESLHLPIHFKQYGQPRNNPYVRWLMKSEGLGVKAAWAKAVEQGLEKAPEEKGGATWQDRIWRQKPPAFGRIKNRLNQQPPPSQRSGALL